MSSLSGFGTTRRLRDDNAGGFRRRRLFQPSTRHEWPNKGKRKRTDIFPHANGLGHARCDLDAHRRPDGTGRRKQRWEIQQLGGLRLPWPILGHRTTERRTDRLHGRHHLRPDGRHGHVAHHRRIQPRGHQRSTLKPRREHQDQLQRQASHARLLLRHHLLVLRLDGALRRIGLGPLRSRHPLRQRQRWHQRRHLRDHVGHGKRSGVQHPTDRQQPRHQPLGAHHVRRPHRGVHLQRRRRRPRKRHHRRMVPKRGGTGSPHRPDAARIRHNQG